MKKYNAILSGSGSNRDKVSKSNVFVALITKNFILNDKCIGEARDAQALKKPMYALIEEGIVIPKELKQLDWKEVYFFNPGNFEEKSKALLTKLTKEDDVK